jgi:purine-binding chemotaxis protein CheW
METTLTAPPQAASNARSNAGPAAPPNAETRAGKYLSFHLNGEEFGIQVHKVREIMGVQEITAVPQTPAHVKGVINLRGKVIPVVDLRLKFGMPAAEYTHRTCIVVVQVAGTRGPVLMGVVVDSVSEVMQATASDIEDAPCFGQEAIPYVLGLAKIKGKVKILLDIDHVMSERELARLDLAALH